MKVAILGYSGSGKSTLANFIANQYNIPLLHLDRVQFVDNWEERNKDEARNIVDEFMKNDNWVIDGNYTDFYQKERLEEASKIIFLDFPRWICLTQAVKRYFQYRNKIRPDMADGCLEKLDLEFVWWILYKGRTKKKRNAYLKIVEEYKDKVIVIKNIKKLDSFYKTIGSIN